MARPAPPAAHDCGAAGRQGRGGGGRGPWQGGRLSVSHRDLSGGGLAGCEHGRRGSHALAGARASQEASTTQGGGGWAAARFRNRRAGRGAGAAGARARRGRAAPRRAAAPLAWRATAWRSGRARRPLRGGAAARRRGRTQHRCAAGRGGARADTTRPPQLIVPRSFLGSSAFDIATACPAAATASGPPPTLLTPLEIGASPLTATLQARVGRD
jgi:hypothetical protein